GAPGALHDVHAALHLGDRRRRPVPHRLPVPALSPRLTGGTAGQGAAPLRPAGDAPPPAPAPRTGNGPVPGPLRWRPGRPVAGKIWHHAIRPGTTPPTDDAGGRTPCRSSPSSR